MKNLVLILLLGIFFLSCKKEEVQPIIMVVEEHCYDCYHYTETWKNIGSGGILIHSEVTDTTEFCGTLTQMKEYENDNIVIVNDSVKMNCGCVDKF